MQKKELWLICLFFTSVLLSNAQTVRISIDMKDTSVEKVLDAIESRSEYHFLYDTKEIDVSKQVNISAKNQPIDKILGEVFRGTGISWRLDNKHIILIPAKKAEERNQQQKKVSGVIIDSRGEPIIGASIVEQGTGKGEITDLKGSFSLQTSYGSKLVISYIGYTTKEIQIREQNDLRIVLEEDVKKLEEIVVIGYGTITKKEMTSAISHISSKDFLKSSSLDAAMLIQGKAAGVTVSNIGIADPNRSASIQIRGVSSRNAGLDPLVVVDGIPGGNLTNINPEDIESIDILKDGAASAIYGTRASNGVIMVTTKKGTKDGNLHVTYNASFTLNKAKNELKILNAEQFRAYRVVTNSILDKGGNTDWLKEITQIGIMNKHALTLAGGKVGSSYRATVDYRDARGIDLRSNRREYGARINLDHSTKSKLFNFTINAAPRVINREKSDWSAFTAALWANPTKPIYNEDVSNGVLYTDFLGETAAYNPVERLRLEQNGTEIKLLEWDATAKLNILPFNPDKSTGNTLLSTQITFAQSITNKFDYFYRPSTSNVAIASGFRGEASREYANWRQDKVEWISNFSTNIEEHAVRIVGGYSYHYDVSSGLAGSNKNFSADVLTYNNLGAGEYLAATAGRTGVSSFKKDSRLIGFFGRLSYDWKKRYLFTASYRHEGSSRFGLNNKWGGFPAVSAGWMISSEPFMKNAKFINELKIRVDFGVTGNQDIGNYHSLSTYRAFGHYLYNGSYFNVWGPSSNANTDLRWEKGYNKNIGIDYALFNNRFSGSVNYYHRKQVDLLGNYTVPVPPNLFSTIFANVGSMQNHGIEFDLNIDVIKRKDFSYTIALIGAINDNKFLNFSNDVYQGEDYYWTCVMSNPNNPGAIQQIHKGERIGNFVTYRYAGVSEYGNWLIYNAHGDVIPIGEGTDADKTITGNGLPWFTGSMTNTFTYKNWDLSVFFRTALGFDIFNVHDFYWGLQSGEGNVLEYAYSKNAKITTGKNVASDYFIEKGDYLKLDMVNLGYFFKIPSKYINSIRASITANNIYTFTRFLGVDPSTYEINGLTPGTWGGGISYYPSALQCIFGLSINF